MAVARIVVRPAAVARSGRRGGRRTVAADVAAVRGKGYGRAIGRRIVIPVGEADDDRNGDAVNIVGLDIRTGGTGAAGSRCY